MELRRLRYFAAVADELHFTRAAGKLRVAQPHLSQEIRKLEQEMRVELFARTRRSVVLTAAGEVFLQRVRAIFDATTDAVSAAQRASRGETGRLGVGFVSVAAYSVMPQAIADYRRAYPDVELALSELNSDEGLDDVRCGRLDVCLLHPPRNIEPDLGAETAWEESLVVAVPDQHALANATRIRLSQLKTEPWVFWHRDIASRLHDDIMGVCRAAGFEPHVAQRTVRLATVVSLVASGVGVAVVPATAAHMGIKGVVFRPLVTRVSVPIAFVWRRREATPALAPFMAALRAAKLNALNATR